MSDVDFVERAKRNFRNRSNQEREQIFEIYQTVKNILKQTSHKELDD